jgi:hypothetical protein
MASLSLALGLLVVLQARPAATPETTADAVVLRDGSVVLGQVAESSPRGPLVMYVRRAWAEANLPDRARRWAAAERPELRRAAEARRDRLAAWRSERVKEPGREDRIAAWLDRELDHPIPADGPPEATLMVVTIGRAEVKSVARRPKAAVRMLRQGWLSGFRDVETLKPADLASALEDRGFAPGGEEPVAIDRLLPIPSETDRQWLLRRAATEVRNDAGLRFIQIQNLLMPEPGPGAPLTLDGAQAMLSSLAPLLEGKPADPLADQLRAVAQRGRVGTVVTQQEMSPALDAVRITISLWVRAGKDWSKAGTKTASVRADALRPGEGDDLAQDPQVGAVFRVFESVGFGFSPEIKQRSLNIGAATRKALGMARTEFTDGLVALELPIDRPVDEKKDRPPAP